MKKKIWF